jgi:serine/threonine protein kinase
MALEDKLIFDVYQKKTEIDRDVGRIIYEAINDTNYQRVFLTRYLLDPALNKGVQLDRINKIMEKSKVLEKLNHPNVAVLYKAGEFEKSYYTAVEYVEGRSLRKYLASKIILDFRLSINIIIQILQGLGHAHAQDIIHGNLNPDNIILQNIDRLKILNFDAAESYSTKTREYEIFNLNSIGYLSPEHFSDIHKLSAKSDIYSVSCLLYQLVTGNMACPFPDFQSYITKMTNNKYMPIPPSRHNPKIPESLETVILNGLCPDPITRYQQVEEMITDLQAVLIQLDGGLRAEIEKRFFIEIPEPEKKIAFYQDPAAVITELINSLRKSINTKIEPFAEKMGILSEDLLLPIIEKKYIYTASVLVVIAMLTGLFTGVVSNISTRQPASDTLTIAGVKDLSYVQQSSETETEVETETADNDKETVEETLPESALNETSKVSEIAKIEIQNDVPDSIVKIFNIDGTVYDTVTVRKNPANTTILGIEPGAYTVKIIKDGYEPIIKRNLLIESGKTFVISDNLVPVKKKQE